MTPPYSLKNSNICSSSITPAKTTNAGWSRHPPNSPFSRVLIKSPIIHSTSDKKFMLVRKRQDCLRQWWGEIGLLRWTAGRNSICQMSLIFDLLIETNSGLGVFKEVLLDKNHQKTLPNSWHTPLLLWSLLINDELSDTSGDESGQETLTREG